MARWLTDPPRHHNSAPWMHGGTCCRPGLPQAITKRANVTKLSFKAKPKALQQWGPNLRVIIQPIGDPPEVSEPELVPAIVDTGSEISGVSPRIAEKLKLPRAEPRNHTTLKGRRRSEPTVRAKIVFGDGVERHEIFSILDFIDDYDVLIGRDLLKDARLFIDFVSGEWHIEFLEPENTAND